MNKGLIIGIAIAIIVGVGVLMVIGDSSDFNEEFSLDEKNAQVSLDEKNEPKQFSIGLSEKVGFSENKP